jgi:hypothetical protein
MICGLCTWKGTRPNKAGLWCNCDLSGRKQIRATDSACDQFSEDLKALEILQSGPHLELENMRLWDLVLSQCSALTEAERIVLFHMRISQNIKRVLDLMDKCQVFPRSNVMMGPVPQLQKAHRQLRDNLKETVMQYPTAEEVESADRVQLARWSRYLSSPGSGAIGTPEFTDTLEKESKVLDRILERFENLGGMTPGISKEIGW